MTDRTYKLSLAACAVTALVGVGILGVGLKGKYTSYQAKQAKTAAERIIKDVKSTTVFLESCDKSKRRCSTGTGFVVSKDNDGAFIVTNKHVCFGSLLTPKQAQEDEGLFGFKPIIIVTHLGQSSGGQIIRVSQNADLCLIRTDLKFKKALKLADKVDKNSKMMTYGFPGGKPELNRGLYLGIEGTSLAFYSVSNMKIWYGASGSAAVDERGNVIGVMSNIRFRPNAGDKPKREDVIQSLFVPLEILREFLGGVK